VRFKVCSLMRLCVSVFIRKTDEVSCIFCRSCLLFKLGFEVTMSLVTKTVNYLTYYNYKDLFMGEF